MTCMKPLALGLGALLWSAPIFSQGWTEVAPLPDGFVSNHSYGFALNGKGYLVAGESTSGYTDSMYEYDPVADAWTALPDFPGAARGYTIGDQWNGQAWMGFGLSNSGYLNDLWMYNPSTGEWTEKASCPCTARTHPAFIAEDGKVFVGLGGGPNGDMDDWWEYDMATDSWSQKPDFPASERHHPYQFGIDGMIYVGFGHNGPNIYNEMYRYDPSTEQWTEVATLPAEGRVAGTQFSYAGKGYALSGDGDDHSSMDEGEFWQYDPTSDDWFQWPSHPGMSRWAPASFVLNDEVYLVNGMSYDPGTFDYMETNWKLAMQPAFANDVAVTAYLGETDICAGDETPITVQLTNMGSVSFAAGSALGLTVVMEIDGEQVLSSDWSGELDTYQTAEFTLGSYAFEADTDFTIRALAADENVANDAIPAEVSVSESATSQWLITLLTDSWGGETGWEVRNSFGLIVAIGLPGSYDSETLYEIPLELTGTGCFTFKLTDEYGDGMNGGTWGGSNGTCTVQSLDDTGSPMNTFFDYDGTYAFDELVTLVSVNSTSGIADVAPRLLAFPNPAADGPIRVEAADHFDRWQVFSSTGALVDEGLWQGASMALPAGTWPAGPLVIILTGEGGRAALPVVKR